MVTDNVDTNKAQILIVDDSPQNRLLLTDILTAAGYSVHQESSGIQALQFAETILPDLVLLDIMMPDMDGFETCRQLKANPATRDIPVIFISALNGVEDQIRGFDVGGVDYIARPFQVRVVVARVETHLALRELRKDLEGQVRARTAELEKANGQLKNEIAERIRAENVLAEDRNLLRTLVDAVPDYIFAKDRAGRFLLANIALADDFGMRPDNLIGKYSSDVLPDDIADQIHFDDNEVMQTGQPLVNQDRVTVGQGGNIRYVLATKIPLRNPQGEVIGLVGVSRDITERHLALEALKESELSYKKLYARAVQQAQFTESLLRNLPVGVLLMTDSWIIMETNQELSSMTGWSEDELRQQSVDHILAENHDQKLNAYFQSVATGTSSEGFCETSIVRKDGSQLTGRIRAARLADADGKLVGILSTIEDITQIAIAEEARREAEMLRIELEKEKELGDLKARFISMASHEFRTPLATIQATMDSLHNYYDRMEPEHRAQRFQKIGDQIKRVTTLLDNVLTIQRIESQGEDFTATLIDLNLFLEEFADQFQRDRPDQTIVYSYDDKKPCMVIADKTLLKKIAFNLVSNAIAYSPNQDPVQVQVTCGPDDIVVIRVSDKGIGIPEVEQKHLFSSFFRGSNTTGVPGAGLGLAIAKSAVEHHGGTITFESTIDVGTTFTVTLPTHRPALSDRI